MSTLAVIFDPHFWPHRRHGGPLVRGINRRAELCLDVGQRAIRTASQPNAPLIVAGDLIDSAGPVVPQFAFALRQQLAANRRSVTLMLGNHDMTADGDHSLGIYTRRDDFTDVRVCDDISFMSGDCLTDFDLGSDEACLVPFTVTFATSAFAMCPWSSRTSASTMTASLHGARRPREHGTLTRFSPSCKSGISRQYALGIGIADRSGRQTPALTCKLSTRRNQRRRQTAETAL